MFNNCGVLMVIMEGGGVDLNGNGELLYGEKGDRI